MTEPAFEARLARGLNEMADAGIRPFDARAVAESVVVLPRGRFGIGPGLATRDGRRLVALAAAALLLLGLLGLALTFVGTRPPETGRLAFVRNGEIWVANIDGTGVRRLVAHGPAQSGPGCAGVRWSPDGTRLAAALDGIGGPAGGHRVISVLTAEGVAVGSFDLQFGSTPLEGPGLDFAWSPDGEHVAVLAPRAIDGGLWLLDGDGTLEREIEVPPALSAANPTYPLSISWSPDGRFLAVTGCPCSPGNTGTWILAVDGSGFRQVQAPGGGNTISLAWGPDGRRLAIASATWTGQLDPGTPSEVWVTDIDGGSARHIASMVEVAQVTGWSRDGTWIVFLEPGALDVVRADGTGSPIRVDAAALVTRWSERQRLFYLTAPPNQSGAPPSDTGQAAGSIMALDPVDGEPAVVVDHVDAFAPFDLH